MIVEESFDLVRRGFDFVRVIEQHLSVCASCVCVAIIFVICPFAFVGVIQISNLKLVFGICIASVPDIITLTVQSKIFPLTIDSEARNSVCSSRTEGIFLALYATWKTIWLLCGLGIAYLVQKVPRKCVQSLYLLYAEQRLSLTCLGILNRQ